MEGDIPSSDCYRTALVIQPRIDTMDGTQAHRVVSSTQMSRHSYKRKCNDVEYLDDCFLACRSEHGTAVHGESYTVSKTIGCTAGEFHAVFGPRTQPRK